MAIVTLAFYKAGVILCKKRKDMSMKKYKKQICLIAAVCLLGTAAFCGYHIYDHYADEAEQTEAFENIAEIVEQAQAEDGNAPEVPLTEEENILTEYGELYLKNTDMVGWLSIAGTTLNYPVMQTPNEPNYYLKHNFEKEYSDLGTPYIQENCDLIVGHLLQTEIVELQYYLSVMPMVIREFYLVERVMFL